MKGPVSIERGTAAAVFVDLQEEHRQDKRYLVEGFGDILANVQRLQATARANDVLLYHSAYIVDLTREARRFHPVDANGRSAFSDKDDPLTAICPEVAPVAGEMRRISDDRAYVDAVLRDGGERAGALAEATMKTVRDIIGLLQS
ncbi:MAG: isochorismatase family protein [Mesorhizobium sp.]|nr:MAG: isochorismatase family protein [Mesorhizobium sp.]